MKYQKLERIIKHRLELVTFKLNSFDLNIPDYENLKGYIKGLNYTLSIIKHLKH